MAKTGQFALLGILSRGPHSGYDIKRAIEESTAHFWSESFGQIYPNLKGLEHAGLATSETQRQEGRPDRKVYAITRQGREALEAWLGEPARFAPPRNETLLKLFFGRHVGPKEMARHLETYRSRYRQDLETYEGIERWLETDFPDHPDLPYWLMTLSHGRHLAEARLRWCDETLDTLDTLRVGTKGER
jgi:PadR family transcriptional regulator AphA